MSEAIDAADETFQVWSQTTTYERAIYLKKMHGLMIEHPEELAEIIAMEMPYPIKELIG